MLLAMRHASSSVSSQAERSLECTSSGGPLYYLPVCVRGSSDMSSNDGDKPGVDQQNETASATVD